MCVYRALVRGVALLDSGGCLGPIGGTSVSI